MLSYKSLITLALLAIVSLAGAKCTVVATSGGGSSSDKDEECDPTVCVALRAAADVPVTAGDVNPVVETAEGRLVDAPVQGVHYVSGPISGITGDNGEFRYAIGNRVQFFIGDIALGEAVNGKPVITPLDLVPGGTRDTPAVINIARLLQSLDSIPGDDVITIPAGVRAAAIRSNEAVSASIRHLDFADETAFVNSATQLVATLTAAYPFTAVLVDTESAQKHLLRSLDRLQNEQPPVYTGDTGS